MNVNGLKKDHLGYIKYLYHITSPNDTKKS